MSWQQRNSVQFYNFIQKIIILFKCDDADNKQPINYLIYDVTFDYCLLLKALRKFLLCIEGYSSQL